MVIRSLVICLFHLLSPLFLQLYCLFVFATESFNFGYIDPFYLLLCS